MSYKILSQREEITVRTIVQFDFLSEPVDISHFMPADDTEIAANIATREASELAMIGKLVDKADSANIALEDSGAISDIQDLRTQLASNEEV